MLSPEILSIDCEKVSSKIVRFIRKKIDASGLKGGVISASGGLDSSTLLVLTVKALGKDRVKAVTMPERDVTPKTDITDVMQLSQMIGVTCDLIDITPMINLAASIHPAFSLDNVSLGNIKARIRMMIAYSYANIYKMMVIGSSNKTELLTGYFTKYGDGAADMLPLADLYKTQVRLLASYLRLSPNILNKTPSARLWSGQTTEEELGLPFEKIDLILTGLKRKMSIEEISSDLNLPESKVFSILERVKRNEHKRRLPLILRLS
ncbi:NAD+ synthase [Candidatus Bathyarchaeota archaeon]|nr:NAD+ synthase [Candidatus Bathyarchaeota archaeon]MBS7630784.1 NAD+ synthase [Candidatus Bathyarchaeota archaeon]